MAPDTPGKNSGEHHLIDLNEVFDQKDDSVTFDYEAEIRGQDELQSFSAESTPSNDQLRRLAQHHRPPQQWYDDDDNPFQA